MVHNYRHQLEEGIQCTDQLGKIVCVGRNYADHARELNNPIPTEPLLFIKPATAAASMLDPIVIPKDKGSCHHELEMSLLIGRELTNASANETMSAIAGIGLAIDLTLRDLQDSLKLKSQPWERAKAFDASCPLSPFVSHANVNLNDLELELICNGHQQQLGNTADMIFPIASLLAEISCSFTLLPGDVVLTGTPAGVGPLAVGDSLQTRLAKLIEINVNVI